MQSMDTIAAVATPLGTGGIGVVRLSGPEAAAVADRLVRLAGGKTVAGMKGYTCAYGRAGDADGEIDEAVVTLFRAPRSFTGEEIVEIAVHGGVYLVNRLLRACVAAGARPALAGEFTRRAFLNGKLDLTQAEAVADLISAEGRQAARAALSARDGALYRRAEAAADALTGHAAHLAAWIDYPEEEIAEVDPAELGAGLRRCEADLAGLLGTYDTGRIIREGISAAIVGRPNVGKSTLMNLLAGHARSIVTDIAGTTRDIVSDTIRLGEIVLHLSDTAGIRGTDDPVERAGVDLAVGELARAQLVLAVFDGSDALDENDLRVIRCCKDAVCIALVNKNDLPQRLDMEVIRKNFAHVVTLSAKSAEGADALKKKMEELFLLERFDPSAAVVANERQRAAVADALAEVREAADALEAGVSYDAVCVCIERAVDALLTLTGRRATQEVVDQVFSRFCVGK